jgi:hypothetical protein
MENYLDPDKEKSPASPRRAPVTSEAPVVEEMTMEELLKESAPQVRSGGVVTAYVVDVSATG